MDLKTLKNQVLGFLAADPECRDCDIRLMIKIWEMYYPQYLYKQWCYDTTGNLAVKLSDLHKLPRESAIKRVRAQIQNVERLYPPTTWEVARARGWAEDEWKRLLGYEIDDPRQAKFDFIQG